MSKLLLSTSMVVALMAINSALHAEDPKPMPVEPTFGEIQEPAAVSGDEDIINSEEPQVKAGEEAADKSMQTLDEEKKSVDEDTKLSVTEKGAIDTSIDALDKAHKDFDDAIQSAEQLKDDPAAQKEAFKEVDNAAKDVSDKAVELADILKKDDQNDPEVVKLETDVKNELGDVTAAETTGNAVEAAQENLEGAADSEDSEVKKDADLTSAEMTQIDNDSKEHAKETADKITKSLDAAEKLKEGLQKAGLDANDENILELKAAMANLKEIFDGLFPQMKSKTVSKQ